ncbi:tRNA (adenosine(37)-N6)-dimethylallyltransferase MiaA [Aurantimonas coralicida]|uniref:tRNA (adenosine(37)-N6)-dimethylallyltransferase MiaA n=1 Tax=Aurantimonas coralicida TaxID=182270 RepID=UPI001D182720|nr:tRNA (adenosine(37)-N6)-dimethylallyltransferase MiaA [Aurantimonas coralicida]MCC4296323.1 tRNA (adenosine(37)-N6)-dimethylallyltransferase MiaA [Aurantimonas coralicida]
MKRQSEMAGKQAILIAGPTASGKSGLAVELAERHDGVVVNADSMQVYDGLSILTARPDADALARVPHRLYGHVAPDRIYSVGAWIRDVAPVLEEIRAAGRLPILCGGTGLYFKALLGLLDDLPEVPLKIRARWRNQLAEEGAPALHGLLARSDPIAAQRIDPADGQRIVRALEVGEAAGQPLSALQTGRRPGLLDASACVKLVTAPERSVLRQAIAERFAQMMAAGALEEVATFRTIPGAMEGSAAKAIGVAELSAVLDGTMAQDVAVARAATRTRQYAKRQETWFRHQFDESWQRLASPDIAAIETI